MPNYQEKITVHAHYVVTPQIDHNTKNQCSHTIVEQTGQKWVKVGYTIFTLYTISILFVGYTIFWPFCTCILSSTTLIKHTLI